MPLKDIKFGSKVCVIGAGNTGIDCATIARRLGSERVTIIYRRSETEMPAYHFEYQFAMGEGVSFMFLTQPVEIVGNGKVEGIKCVTHGPRSGRCIRSPCTGADRRF